MRPHFHGFAMLGYIGTTGNNFYGDTRNGGDVDYYEAGLNAYIQPRPDLSLSGQLLARKAGDTEDNLARVDYAFIDYQPFNSGAARFGLRAGRIRNPLGFYNETRDVVFTRPSILLPQSTYFEGTGIRELVFSSDGIQAYSSLDHGAGHTELKINLSRDQEASSQTRENFSSGLPSGFAVSDMELGSPIFIQLLHEMDGGRKRLALSYVDTQLKASVTSALTPPLQADIDLELYILSAQYNAEKWSLTGEYSLSSSETNTPGTSRHNRGDGFYLQLQYRFNPEWTGLARQDILYPDRNDRSDDSSRDFTLGVRWSPQPQWLVSAEYHRISGTGGIPLADNRGRILDSRTDLLAVVLGYRF